MGQSYSHLSAEERAAIMLGKSGGASARAIAVLLGRAPSTIARELARNVIANAAGPARDDPHPATTRPVQATVPASGNAGAPDAQARTRLAVMALRASPF